MANFVNHSTWPEGLRIDRLRHVDAADVHSLAMLLIDAVDGGASVGFMHPLSFEKAKAFWSGVAAGVERGERALLVAREPGSGIVGTVQLLINLPENQSHRAEVAKMMVHRAVRRRGLGEALMKAAEQSAWRLGRRLLTLDTASVDAERLYERIGWQRAGEVPEFAMWPHGGLCRTVFFYRALSEA
jgi:GNAT superfamily N-acetyltransferase